MTKKIFIHIAALNVIAMCALSCDSATNDSNGKTDSSITAPVVELSPSVGENPFKGKTFSGKEYYEGTKYNYVKYSFKDSNTIMFYEKYDDKKDFKLDTQYKYSVDANTKVLSWHTEKRQMYGDELLSYSEEIEYRIKELKKMGLSDAVIIFNINIATPTIKKIYTDVYRYKYEYDEANKTLDLMQIYEEDTADFEYTRDYDKYYGKYRIQTLLLWNYYNRSMDIYLYDGKDTLKFQGDLNKSDKTFVLVIYDEDKTGIDENDKITGTYKFTGSGNDTKIEFLFDYDGQHFNPTLDFAPYKIHLTEEE